ncbi:MAG: maleylacetoacetate isomerase [Xanthomonadales bacterium]|nr:maleylacetoacetate isomerase [Xanthomonadales bacterium]
MAEILLYDYWRSSAAYRVRIALNIKGLRYQQRSVHLVRDGGEQKKSEYLAVNPQGLVPALQVDGLTITQSLAILEWLEEQYPQPALLPVQAAERAWVRALAQIVAADIHPLNNLRVMSWLKDDANGAMDNKTFMQWYHHWIKAGFRVIESQLENSPFSGLCCYGDVPGYADACLIPQMYNAERFACDLQEFPRIRTITEYCRKLPAFLNALPENQPDAITS